MKSHDIIVSEWVAVLAVITWAELKQKHVPVPRRYVGASVLFGLLALIAPLTGEEIPALIGFAIVLAILGATLGKEPPARVGTGGRGGGSVHGGSYTPPPAVPGGSVPA